MNLALEGPLDAKKRCKRIMIKKMKLFCPFFFRKCIATWTKTDLTSEYYVVSQGCRIYQKSATWEKYSPQS